MGFETPPWPFWGPTEPKNVWKIERALFQSECLELGTEFADRISKNL